MGLHHKARRVFPAALEWLKPMESGGKLPLASGGKSAVPGADADVVTGAGASECRVATATADVHSATQQPVSPDSAVADVAAGSGGGTSCCSDVATVVSPVAGQAVPTVTSGQGYYASPTAIDRGTRPVDTPVCHDEGQPYVAYSPWEQYLGYCNDSKADSSCAGSSYTRWGVRVNELQQEIMACQTPGG
jgi:hypothetical protein